VLLLGETGTGKELIAHALHAGSGRRARPLIAVNCAALPPSLIESELFGHEKGAFTGATQARPGRFELANGSTLFLDEIGDLDLPLQAKLLRALQEGEIQRLGSSRTHKFDVRIIAATNRDLEAAMHDGRFRADLYYRLAVFPIALPPLRERRDDIPLLVWHIIQSRQRALGRAITQIPQPAMDALVAYAWPGNVRELQNVIERALILSTGPQLQLDEAFGRRPTVARAQDKQAVESLPDAERAHILTILERCAWTIEGTNQAAARLGLRPSTLRNRMRKLGIRRPASGGRELC
jgi:transcriptional regulator with GAF, ATPase, and Fis domain